jgi:hypothetical protein
MYATAADLEKGRGRAFLCLHADLNGDGEPDVDVIEHELDAANKMVWDLHVQAPDIKGMPPKIFFARLQSATVTVAAHRLAMRAGVNPGAELDAYGAAMKWLRAWRAGNLPGQVPDPDYVADGEPERDVRVSRQQAVSERVDVEE